MAAHAQNRQVVRFDGDEYVVILGELDIDKVESTRNADIVAEKSRASMGAPENIIAPPASVLVLFNYHATRKEILKQADIAMCRSKTSGRNRVSFG